MLEKTLENTVEFSYRARRSSQSILREINPEFIGRTVAEAAILWLPGVKSLPIGKTSILGKTEGNRRKG